VVVAETAGRDPEAFAALVALAEAFAIPVINGRANPYANFPTDHPLYLGMGRYQALDDADLVLLVGARAPWYPPRRRPTRGTIVAIDDNPHKAQMIYQNLHADFYLEGDIAHSLKLLTTAMKSLKVDASIVSARRQRWAREHENYLTGLRAEREKARNGSGIDPLSLVGSLGEVMPANTIYMDETITHSPMLRQHLPTTMPQSFFRYSSGGLGQGIGTALGIKLASRGRPVVLLVGDGSFLYNPIIQALGASKRHELPIVIVIFNNKKYAAMRQGHVHHYPDGASASENLHYGVTIDGPNYEELGGHFGFHGQRVEKVAELNDALRGALAATQGGRTAILNACITR
jgi:acetolactate synthase-1/2/3 large subunit